MDAVTAVEVVGVVLMVFFEALGMLEGVGSVLLREKVERGGGDSVDDEGKKPLGFSLETEGFGFNEGGGFNDDCAVIVVVVPKAEPYGLTANGTAGFPGIVGIIMFRD